MTEIMDLRGLSVIVTGASSGIGEATARALHAAGAHPVLAARRTDRLQALSAQLDGALYVQTDVTEAAQVAELVSATLERHGRIDGLVNNAGISLLDTAVEQIDLDEYQRVLNVNLVGYVRLIQAVLPAMRKQGRGRIVNISSNISMMAVPGFGGYASTKSAINMISGVSRAELADDGVAVSVVLPSMTATEFGGLNMEAGTEGWPGFFVHSAEYVAGIILRALRTGEERIEIPSGKEEPEMCEVPVG
jgi:NADP-dependent 3-hydroxy acid dehydrogenase YdfG